MAVREFAQILLVGEVQKGIEVPFFVDLNEKPSLFCIAMGIATVGFAVIVATGI